MLRWPKRFVDDYRRLTSKQVVLLDSVHLEVDYEEIHAQIKIIFLHFAHRLSSHV
jgi:hypothetical protein